MFPTFTGSSRRPRNVNLSGRKTINPFAQHGLLPVSGAGATKTVADAQADRRQRQQERDELKAARAIQRVWRGYRVRQNVKAERRAALYSLASHATAPEFRVKQAFPLVVSAIDTRKDDALPLLRNFAVDLLQTNIAVMVSCISQTRLAELVRILIGTLDRSASISQISDQKTASPSPELLELLIRIIQIRPQALFTSMGPFFALMTKYCTSFAAKDNNTLSLIWKTVAAPLVVLEDTPYLFTERAYSEFATSLLTHPLPLLENDGEPLSKQLDFDLLCEAVVGVYRTPRHRPKRSPEELMWLLAHVIGLQRNAHSGVQSSPMYLGAIYTLLSDLFEDIKLRLPSLEAAAHAGSTTEKPYSSEEAKYIVTQIQSLANKKDVTELLEEFKSTQSSTDQDYASLLAGYAIVLIRCFPEKGDDIRMQFYLADLPTKSGLQPAVQYFWEASSATKLFARILSSPRATLDFLLQRKFYLATFAAPGDEPFWDREWRTVLLFLELYTFVLRLTDDDDFFSPFASGASSMVDATTHTSRVRSSALSLDALKTLSLFLKNLAFTLHYNAAELLHDDSIKGSAPISLSNRVANRMGNYYVLSGVDFHNFKSIITTAIQMLYERDSRRQFLPSGHWLMSSSFDMSQFVSAVVSEEQRQHDLKNEDDGDEDVDMDEEDSDVGSYPPDGSDQPSFTRHSHVHTSRYAMLEKLRRERQKLQRDRVLAAIGPKLEILRNMPYVLPFEARVNIFREFVYLDKMRRREGNVDPDAWRHHITLHGGWGNRSEAREIWERHHGLIHRNAMFDNAYDQFWELGEGLKEPIQITFLDEHDNEEAGIDGGGVTKEFLTCALTDALSTDNALFDANKENELYPNPMMMDQLRDDLTRKGCREGSEAWSEKITLTLRHYEFLGRMIGKSMYEGILLDYAFAAFFLRKWTQASTDAGYRASINDLREMDEQLYQGMLVLKNYDGNVGELDLDFTIEDQVSKRGQPLRTVTRNLIPNGDKMRVTNENRPLYISYVARHRLAAQPHMVTNAFLRGLWMIIDPLWLRMFNQSELQRLVGGDSSEIDLEDLRRNTVYSGVYELGYDNEEHPTVKMFWKVLHSFADEDRRLLLKFVTSTPRAPLLGFSQLQPSFSIRDSGSDETRLPSASTCINLLKLPRYQTEEIVREKVLYAIRSGSRFELS